MKTGVKIDIFWSEIGSGFGEPGGTPTPIIPGRTPEYYASILRGLSRKIIFFSEKNKNKNSFYKKMKTQVSPQYSCVDEICFCCVIKNYNKVQIYKAHSDWLTKH